MFRRILPFALLVAACARDATAPELRGIGTVARATSDAPPAPRVFGPDTYRIGLFTGEGTQRTGLSCDKTAPDRRICSGYLASAVDGALLDVTVEIPLKLDKPVPLIALIHG